MRSRYALVLVVLATLGSCTTSRPRPAELPLLTSVSHDTMRLDSLAQLPAYLVPPPAGSTPAQVRKWQRAQRRNLARVGVAPTTVKIKHSTLAAGTGASAVSAARRSSVATGAGAMAAAVGKARAPVAQGSHVSTDTSLGFPWWIVVVLAVAGALLGLNKWLRGRWFL